MTVIVACMVQMQCHERLAVRGATIMAQIKRERSAELARIARIRKASVTQAAQPEETDEERFVRLSPPRNEMARLVDEVWPEIEATIVYLRDR